MKKGPHAANLGVETVTINQQTDFTIFAPQPQQLSTDARQPLFWRPTVKTYEIEKSSHEKFRLAVDPEGRAKLTLFVSDGRGSFKPTPETFGFHVKHVGKLCALFSSLESAK